MTGLAQILAGLSILVSGMLAALHPPHMPLPAAEPVVAGPAPVESVRGVAQVAAREPHKLEVVGSTPTAATDLRSRLLACIRYWESRGRYWIDTGNGYHGAYQFDWRTWIAFGGQGNPALASPAEQDAVAVRTIAYDGGVKPWRWPTPSRRC